MWIDGLKNEGYYLPKGGKNLFTHIHTLNDDDIEEYICKSIINISQAVWMTDGDYL